MEDTAALVKTLVAKIEQAEAERKEDMRGLRTMISQNADKSVSAHENTRRGMAYIAKMTSDLWRKVEGNDPPRPPHGSGLEAIIDDYDLGVRVSSSRPPDPSAPTLNAALPGPKPVAVSLSEHGNEIAGIHGQLLVLHAGLEEAKKTMTETLDLQKKQTNALGIRPSEDDRKAFVRLVDGILWLITEREGQKFAFSLVAAIASLVAVLRGQLPAASSVPPPAPVQQTAPYVPPPPPALPAPRGQEPGDTTPG